MKSIYKKRNNKNGKFFKGECNNCVNYGHRASNCWVNSNKNDNRNNNKTSINPRFNGGSTNVGKEATGMLIVGRRKQKRNTMISTTSLWEPHYVEKFKKRTMKNILNNG